MSVKILFGIQINNIINIYCSIHIYLYLVYTKYLAPNDYGTYDKIYTRLPYFARIRVSNGI